MRTSLGLMGDLDDVELIQDVERAFAVKLGDEELSACSTVGNLFELVAKQLPDSSSAANRCASGMCFYRVRRALLAFNAEVLVRPSTPIKALRKVPVRAFYRHLREAAGLEPPKVYISGLGAASLLLAAALPAALLWSGLPWWSAILALVLAGSCYRLSPLRFPPEASTFGDFVELVTAHNIAALAEQGARLRPADAWKAFRAVCADHAVTRDEEIGPNTLIYAVR